MSEREPRTRQQFRLTYDGELAPGVTREQVLEELSRLFNRPSENLRPLLSGEPKVLKVAPTAEALEPFRAAMARAGAVAHIRPPGGGAAAPGSGVPRGVAAAPPGPRYAPVAPSPLGRFLDATRPGGLGAGAVTLADNRFLQVDLAGELWVKTGSVVATMGDIRLQREGLLEKGLKSLALRSFGGEGERLTHASGVGRLYLADRGKRITLLRLDGEALVVNCNDLLAFEPGVEWDLRVLRNPSTVIAGGLSNLRLQGKGVVALGTHHEPLTLEVRHAAPVYTDPEATVAWSASLDPRFSSDAPARSVVGLGSGESIQVCFEGDGFVVVQP